MLAKSCKLYKGKNFSGSRYPLQSKKLFHPKTLITLYYSFINPYLTYCLEVRGNMNKLYQYSIFRLQKKAVQIISFAPYKAHSCVLFEKLKILHFDKLKFYCITLFMFKFVNGFLPKIFNDMFISRKLISQRDTRQDHKLSIPKVELASFPKISFMLELLFGIIYVKRLIISIYIFKEP